MLYDVLDVAGYIVEYQEKRKNPFTHLKLQKMLYFLWEYYYSTTHEHLFENRIEAWIHGPVSPEAYERYCVFGGLPITTILEFNTKPIFSNDRAIINKFLENYEGLGAQYLVNFTQQPGTPWHKIVYSEGNDQKYPYREIPYRLIEQEALKLKWEK